MRRLAAGHVVVVGSINVDLTVTVDHLPRPGETVGGGSFARHFGGKGANQAVAAARAGASVTMVGAVGRDQDGDASLAALESEGVDIGRVRRVQSPTGVAIIAVASDGENQIVVAPGANAEVRESDASLEGVGSEADAVLVCLEIPMEAVVAAIASARRLGMLPIVNPAPARPLPAQLAAAGVILTPNRAELTVVAGTADQEQALQSLLRGGMRAVAVTLGAGGVLFATHDQRLHLGARNVHAVDATGAGDTFSGVLATWLAEGRSMEDSVHAANAAAGLSVTRAGARGGMPTRQEIDAALRP